MNAVAKIQTIRREKIVEPLEHVLHEAQKYLDQRGTRSRPALFLGARLRTARDCREGLFDVAVEILNYVASLESPPRAFVASLQEGIDAQRAAMAACGSCGVTWMNEQIKNASRCPHCGVARSA